MQIKETCLLLLFLILAATCKAASEDRSVVLPPDQAKAVLKQCSRATPENVDGAWAIPPNVAAQLEQDLHKLAGLKSYQCCSFRGTVNDPAAYLRQYVGVTIRGKKYVYINAFRHAIFIKPEDKDAWKRSPVMVCDGGSSYWGALYDPETREFLELAFNGLA